MTIYIAAASLVGWLFPEFLKMIAPRNYTVPWGMNVMCAFIGAAVAHYLLTH
jgi:hypothetical protein